MKEVSPSALVQIRGGAQVDELLEAGKVLSLRFAVGDAGRMFHVVAGPEVGQEPPVLRVLELR